MSLFRTALRVCAMELRTAARDRQTVLYTVVLPLVLYPAIFWIMIQGVTLLKGRDEITAVRVAVSGELDAVPTERLFEALREAGDPELEVGPVRCEPIQRLDEAQATERLQADEGLDAVLLLDSQPVVLLYDGTRSRSHLATTRVSQRLERLAHDVRAEELERGGFDPAVLAAFELERRDLASSRALGAYVFSFILPMTFVIMAVMGAFYPAVDVTAGEKERGTAETTLLLPVSRLGLQLGKVLVVTTGALVATVLNLFGLVLAAEPLVAGLGKDIAIEVPWSTLFFALPFCAAFLVTTSALLVAIASFTNTFKQGQALLGGVQMIFILPAVLAIMPGVELRPDLALVPVVQTVLAFKTVLQGAGDHGRELVIVFVSQLVYAWLALLLSLRLSSREALLMSGASLRRVFVLWRTEGAPR